eukprot:PhF_6_TR602/c2_g1_i1/m.721
MRCLVRNQGRKNISPTILTILPSAMNGSLSTLFLLSQLISRRNAHHPTLGNNLDMCVKAHILRERNIGSLRTPRNTPGVKLRKQNHNMTKMQSWCIQDIEWEGAVRMKSWSFVVGLRLMKRRSICARNLF